MHRVMATPNLKDGLISVIDMKTWKTLKILPTLGPGFFLRGHENSAYVWADVFSGPNKDVMHVIDKQKLEIVATLRRNRQDHDARGIRPLRQIRAGVAVGNGRRADRL